MTVGGAFLGGGSIKVPAGKCQLIYQIMTEDRANLSGATITATDNAGHTYAETTGSDGYATELVDASGQIYTVSISVTGYDNISAQKIVAESGITKYVRFELDISKIQKSKIATSFRTSPSNENVPSEKLIYDRFLKQTELFPAIRTISGFTIVEAKFFRRGNVVSITINFTTTKEVKGNLILSGQLPKPVRYTSFRAKEWDNVYIGMGVGNNGEFEIDISGATSNLISIVYLVKEGE